MASLWEKKRDLSVYERGTRHSHTRRCRESGYCDRVVDARRACANDGIGRGDDDVPRLARRLRGEPRRVERRCVRGSLYGARCTNAVHCAFEVVEHVLVADAKDAPAEASERDVPSLVLVCTRIVTGAVDLDDEAGFGAGEVGDAFALALDPPLRVGAASALSHGSVRGRPRLSEQAPSAHRARTAKGARRPGGK
jgi:hypothetical protein